MEQDELGYGEPILVVGDNRLVYSISVCLLRGGHAVTVVTTDKKNTLRHINIHIQDLKRAGYKINDAATLKTVDTIEDAGQPNLIIAVTSEDVQDKKACIRDLEKAVPSSAVIAINTESISLETLQEGSSCPERIIGLNWVEPAHTTFFLELITNSEAGRPGIDRIYKLAKKHWHKDPYIISGNYGIRSRMFAAMAREAFYLVQHGYASIEDIDRACRNDAGYYLPFAGNCRYMDLMGSYAYGMVMKELNPDLSRSREIPEFFDEITRKGSKGMENGAGFYSYRHGEPERWDILFREFSYRIARIIEKYPFGKNVDFTAEHKAGKNGKE